MTDPLIAALIAVEENAELLRGKAGDPGIVWRGTWDWTQVYQPGDVVSFEGSAYICRVETTARPPSSDWELFAAKGADGARAILRPGGTSSGSGAALEVKDEGVSLDAAVSSINVVGTALTATNVLHAVTLTSTAITQAAADSAYQPLDSDLTAIAALSTTSYGRSLLAAADAPGLRTLAGAVIGTNVQAWDADLDTLAAATITAAGFALLDDADAAAQRTTLGLGTLATQSGTFSGTSSGTNTGDQTLAGLGGLTQPQAMARMLGA